VSVPPAAPRASAPAASKPARPQLAPSDVAANLPDYSRVSAGMPPLRLDLHSYSEQPQQRYALINMHKVQEGDTLPEGPRVLHILPDGVVLSYQGTEFVLGRN
jgi:general secretion pathway protein B